jgi:ribulose-phosphate 3-epimerase
MEVEQMFLKQLEKQMKIISPSILGGNLLNIQGELEKLNQLQNIWLHLDVMDGHFVPNLTFGSEFIKRIAKSTFLPLDCHFMVTNPEFYIEDLKTVGIHNFTIHYELPINHLNLISAAKQHYKSVGLSVKPATDVNDIDINILRSIDLLLVMSVEPGFAGQGFIESTWKKLTSINEFKIKHNLNFTIQVDGGINNLNAPKLFACGAENLVVGSHFFKSSDYSNTLSTLRA